MLHARLPDRFLTGQFALTINTQWTDRCVFGVRLGGITGKDVICRVVDQPGVDGPGLLGQHASGLGIDAMGEFGFLLCLVDGGIGGSIDNQGRLDFSDRLADRRRVGQVQRGLRGSSQGRDLAEAGQGPLQLKGHLAFVSDDQNTRLYHTARASLDRSLSHWPF